MHMGHGSLLVYSTQPLQQIARQQQQQGEQGYYEYIGEALLVRSMQGDLVFCNCCFWLC
jgi:hypothetical protein